MGDNDKSWHVPVCHLGFGVESTAKIGWKLERVACPQWGEIILMGQSYFNKICTHFFQSSHYYYIVKCHMAIWVIKFPMEGGKIIRCLAKNLHSGRKLLHQTVRKCQNLIFKINFQYQRNLSGTWWLGAMKSKGIVMTPTEYISPNCVCPLQGGYNQY